ncbi:MAG TPA: MDR family MFS transporter [Candidatus Dormibacteraeota bacterium]|nr:MDR family MFS transporter [Candidatus Dormibacteraeota bacterium]
MDQTALNKSLPSTKAELSHNEIMVIMLALMLAILLAALDQTIVATALPKIASDLNGLSKLSWVATAYLLTSAVSTPLYGKISDMFGRKKIFQTAIVIFLFGSALCGLSQNMDQLIFFRALQGIGAGGLMTLALAVIGDIVPPRQRGRYQGYFGAVFAFSSIIGPLLGGFFADSHLLGWRWIFYINLPVGILAMSAIATRLHLPVRRTEHRVDYLGAVLLATAIVSLLLVTVWGGATFAWLSNQIIGLAILSLVSAILFVLREQRAPEPVVPLRLFKNDIFSVAAILSLLAGFVMFGAIIFLPEYQQIVRGYSATKSGLLMLPLIGGLLTAVLSSGRLITRFGRYRIFPIVGSIFITIGLWLFSHISLTTSQLTLSIWMVVLGLGIGPFMQVTTLAVQNSVNRADLGTATSAVTFFRSFGSSLGAALFGAILVNRLTYNLHRLLPPQAAALHITARSLQSSAAGLRSAPPQIVHIVLEAFASAFHVVFLWAIPFAAVMFLVTLKLRETPLKTSTHDIAEGQNLETAK